MNFPAPLKLPWLLLISVFVFSLDRWTKDWVSGHIALGGAIPVLDHVFRLSHWCNDGAAFSMFADSASPHTVRWGLITFTILASIAVLIAMIRLGSRFTATTIALALIFGGALGNVHDRVEYGCVTDFLEVHIYHYHWPDFNVADSAVVIGACLLVLDSLMPRRPEPEPDDGTQ